jgi:signal transduction histidine kinase
MKERAALAGGRLEIESASGEGTKVRAVFPLRWRNRAA